MLNVIKNNKYLLVLIPILIGFHIIYGLQVIIPTNIDWLMSAYHDWGQHYLGWAFFRSEEWTFPLGHIENFNFPAGTNVGYTDSIPILAIFFKIFSFALPETFQYYGIWLLSCYLLIAYFSVKILNRYKLNIFVLVLLTILISFNPILVYRSMHPALCAHWLILASLYYYLLAEDDFLVKRALKNQGVLTIISSLINPYLLFIVAGFGVILPVKSYFFRKEISLKSFVFYMVTPILLVLFCWYIIGMISFNSNVDMEVSNSYGLYSFNLNSFWNPDGFSNVLPGLKKVSPHQYEGYGYLGLGLIIFIVIALLLFFTRLNTVVFKRKSLLLLLILGLSYFVFSITNVVTYNDNSLFTFYIPAIIKKLGGVFRASGRFVWVLYYLMIFFAIIVFINSKLSKKVKIGILSIIVIIQFIDIKPMLLSRSLPFGKYVINKFDQNNWVKLTSGYDKIITYKPFNNHLGYRMSYQDICYIALKNKLPITCGYVARETSKENKKYIDSLNLALSRGRIDKKAIYIIAPDEIEKFYYVLQKNEVEIRFLDGFYFLNSIENKNKFKEEKSLKEQTKIQTLYENIQKANFVISLKEQPLFNTDRKIKSNLERNIQDDFVFQYKGWAYLKNGSNNAKDSIYMVLAGNKQTYLYKTNLIKRPDVAGAFNNEGLVNSGFFITIFKEDLNIDDYELGIAVKSENSKWVYQLLEQSKINLNSSSPPKEVFLLPNISEGIIKNIETIEEGIDSFMIKGWGAIEGKDATQSEIKIILKSENKIYQVNVEMKMREDVTKYYKNKGNFNYDNTGFLATIKKDYLEKGTYYVGILINHEEGQYFNLTDKEITVE